MKHINSEPPAPGKYHVSWSEEVTRSAVIEFLPEDCAGSVDLRDALISALNNGGHPDKMETEIEGQDDFYVTRKAQQ